MFLRRVTGAITVGAFLFAPMLASATPVSAALTSPQSSSLVSNGTVVARCTNLPANISVSFGSYDVFADVGNHAPNQHFSINCTKGAEPVISFSGGPDIVDTATRKMTDGNGNYLAFQPWICFSPIQLDVEYLDVHGLPSQVPNGTYCGAATPAANLATTVIQPYANGNQVPSETINFTFGNWIPQHQNVPVGYYSDAFTMSMNY